jgi:CRISPR-associated protein Cas1
METLYVLQEKCAVHREGGHLKITKYGEKTVTIPIAGAKTAVVFDSVNIKPPALDLLLANGIDVIYMSKWGKIKGSILSAKGGGAVVKLAQHSAFLNAEKRLEIAKSIVSAKTRNQMSVVRKYQHNNTLHDFDGKLADISRYSGKLGAAESIDEIMGIEGVSARCYWECFGKLLKNPVFDRREYRPSPDYVNALLNLTYAFLCNEISTALAMNKFDLEIGFLHSIHYGRNSLALDIMEEFRAPFADSWLLGLFNKNQFKGEHFHMPNGDYRLTDGGFRKFCGLFHDRVPPWRDKFRKRSNGLCACLQKAPIRSCCSSFSAQWKRCSGLPCF